MSKSDLADEETLEIVRDEIADLTKGTFLQDAPVLAASSKTGAGLTELKAELARLAAGVFERDTAGPYRQPVDRVFHKKGIGVVITGSCYSGAVRVGDALEVLPRGLSARVRGVQSFNENRSEGFAGERLAVALQGVKLEAVSRGDTLTTPGAFTATEAIDARLQLAVYYDFELKNRERIRIHHGASEVLGRVILLEHDLLRSGDDALAQIKLEKPLVAAEGDHVVLRKYSPPGVIDQLKLKEEGDPRDVLLKAIEHAGLEGVNRKTADAELLQAVLQNGAAVEIDTVVFHRGALDSLAEEVEDLAGSHQARFPLQWGIDKEELRQKTRFPHGATVFNKVLDGLREYRPVFVKGNRVRSGSAEMVLAEAELGTLTELRDKIRGLGVAFPSRAELERDWKSRHRLADALQYLKDTEDILEIGDAGVIHRDALGECVDELKQLFEQRDEVSVADLKNSLGLTRKHAIPLLEALDEQKVTKRSGNNRTKGPRFPD
jgi:selenocysteine-specific elongation factor